MYVSIKKNGPMSVFVQRYKESYLSLETVSDSRSNL